MGVIVDGQRFLTPSQRGAELDDRIGQFGCEGGAAGNLAQQVGIHV